MLSLALLELFEIFGFGSLVSNAVNCFKTVFGLCYWSGSLLVLK